MLPVQEFLDDLRRRGVEMRADGGQIVYRARGGVLTKRDRARLARWKPFILDALGAKAGRRADPVTRAREHPIPPGSPDASTLIGVSAGIGPARDRAADPRDSPGPRGEPSPRGGASPRGRPPERPDRRLVALVRRRNDSVTAIEVRAGDPLPPGTYGWALDGDKQWTMLPEPVPHADVKRDRGRPSARRQGASLFPETGGEDGDRRP